jgi:hypothetical protein
MRFALLLRKILFVSLGSVLLLASAHAQQKASALTGINWVPVTGNGPPTATSCGVTCNSTFLGLPYIDVLNNNTYVYTGTGAVNGFLQTNASTGGSIPTTPLNALVKINGAGGAASSLSDNGTLVSTSEGISATGFVQVTQTGTLPAMVDLGPNTGTPTISGGVFSLMGFSSSSSTGGYGWQPQVTPPTGNQVLAIGAPGGTGVAPITYIANSVNVNGTTCTLGGSVCLPISNVCGGDTGNCPLQQTNPTTGATTTLNAAITSTQTTLPIANGTGFTFTPGNYVLIGGPGSGAGEWVACSGFTPTTAPAGNLTGCDRAQYGTTASNFVSGVEVVQMVQGVSASANTFPSSYVLANQAYQYGAPIVGGIATNITANTVQNSLPYIFQNNVTLQGSVLAAGNGASLFSPQVTVMNQVGMGTCLTSSTRYALGSNSIPFVISNSSQNCTLGTNFLVPNAMVITFGTGIGVNPVAGDPAAAWLTNTGQWNVEQGYSANVVTLTGATPVINAANAMQTITLSANATPTVTNITAGIKGLTIQVCQPASGGPFTWTWPAAFHGAVTVGTTANTCTVQVFDSFTGTTLFPESAGTLNVAP